MARARNIKPGFFKNEVLGGLNPIVRLIFIGLWTIADREGRIEYRPKRIKMEVCPYDEINIEDAIAELIEEGFLIGYEVFGLQLLQVVNWSKHQNPHHKEIASTFPPPIGHVNGVCDGYIPLSNTIRRRIYARDGKVCKSCGATHGLSIDHIVPISNGGNSTDDNLQVLCMGCNFAKSNKILCKDHESISNDTTMDHAQVKRNASCPTDSLNPLPLTLNPPRAPTGARDGFQKFWQAYPKKKSKGDAEKAWKSIKPDEQLQDRILNALERAKTSESWRKNGGQFIPYPATWLRAKGWDDEDTQIAEKKHTSILCSDCGEPYRAKFDDKPYCLPCYDKHAHPELT